MRSMWKGHLRFHLVTIPIKLYSAAETSSTISFNQLHEKDNGRIGYVKTCKRCGQEVPNDEIVKGYQYEPDQYVIVDDEDLDKLRVRSTKIIDIEGFVNRDEVHPTLFEKPYYAGPDGVVATKTYALLREALARSDKIGVGRVVLRDRESFVAMAPHGPGIVFYKLRFPQEVRPVQAVPQIDEAAEVDEKELKLASQLVDTMAIAFSELEFVDHYQQALKELITAKIEGREIVTAEEEEREPVDILSALEESIERAREDRKPMQKADGRAGRKRSRKTGS
jgi:DNA end-binding protein Ku